MDRAKRYHRLALLLAEEEPARRIRPNIQIGAARGNFEESVNHKVKIQAAD
jgi:hypothetical protein